MKQQKEFGLLKEMEKELRDVKKRLSRVERAVPIEVLTKADLKAIEKSEKEFKEGKYFTAERLKKKLGIE